MPLGKDVGKGCSTGSTGNTNIAIGIVVVLGYLVQITSSLEDMQDAVSTGEHNFADDLEN